MRNFELIIKHPDGQVYWKENFDTKVELNRWLANEKLQPYWKKDFIVEVVDNSAAVEAEKKRIENEIKQEQQKVQDRIEAIKDDLKKKPKTIAEVVLLLEKIAEHLGIDLKD